MQPSSTLSEKAIRKLPRWVQSRTRLGRHLAHQDIAEITRTTRASRAEAGPRIVHTIDTVQVVPPASLACLRESASAHILSWLRHTGADSHVRVLVRGRRLAQQILSALPERRASLSTIPCHYEL